MNELVHREHVRSAMSVIDGKTPEFAEMEQTPAFIRGQFFDDFPGMYGNIGLGDLQIGVRVLIVHATLSRTSFMRSSLPLEPSSQRTPCDHDRGKGPGCRALTGRVKIAPRDLGPFSTARQP